MKFVHYIFPLLFLQVKMWQGSASLWGALLVHILYSEGAALRLRLRTNLLGISKHTWHWHYGGRHSSCKHPYVFTSNKWILSNKATGHLIPVFHTPSHTWEWMLVPLYPGVFVSNKFSIIPPKRCRTCNYLENGNSWINATSHSGNAGEFWGTWTLDPKFKWEHSRAQSQCLTQLSGQQWSQSVTAAAVRHFQLLQTFPRTFSSQVKMQGKHFYCCLVFGLKYVKFKKDQEVFICINIYSLLCNLPRNTNFSNSEIQPFHATRN